MRIVTRILPILLSLLYVASPVDAVPDFLPGIGWLDDLLVIGFVLWYMTRGTPGRFTWEAFRQRMSGSSHRPSSGSPREENLSTDFGEMDPYALLEVSPTASQEELKAAYKRAVGRYHPDKVAHLGKEFQDLAHKKLLAIQEAYQRLQGKGR